MKLVITRKIFDDLCSLGELTVDGEFECYTLEPVTRPEGAEKIPGKTAIPYGTYKVIITYSNHMGIDLPLLVDVPNFEGVRIHPGNFPANTEGCTLVGENQGHDEIQASRTAFDGLFGKIRQAIAQGDTVMATYQPYVEPVAEEALVDGSTGG
jgi:hypothetical protein